MKRTTSQKIIFRNSRGEKLVGILHRPKRECDRVFIIAHGFTANKDRVRLRMIADALAENGYAAFRFDFGGCGESQEREITVKGQVADLKAAITLMRQRGFRKVGLVGESLGGLTSLLAYDPNVVETLILLAPVTKSKRVLSEELTEEKFQRQFRDYGFAFYEKDGRRFKIPREYLQERLNVDQKGLLSLVVCPTLIIHGDSDSSVPLRDSKEALRFLPAGSRLEIIRGANHKFEGKEEEVVQSIIRWIRNNVN